MEKFKACPSCGEKNSPASIECCSCEADLTGVRVLDTDTEKMLLQSASESSQTATATVRVCDCGVKNPVAVRKCSGCGEDISDISPSEDVTDTTKFILSTIDGDYAYEIVKDITVVGREQEMKEYLCRKPFVSRSHAKLVITETGLTIENLSETNYTYVNNTKILPGDSAMLADGDELGFGGFVKNGERQDEAAYFIVRIGSCT